MVDSNILAHAWDVYLDEFRENFGHDTHTFFVPISPDNCDLKQLGEEATLLHHQAITLAFLDLTWHQMLTPTTEQRLADNWLQILDIKLFRHRLCFIFLLRVCLAFFLAARRLAWRFFLLHLWLLLIHQSFRRQFWYSLQVTDSFLKAQSREYIHFDERIGESVQSCKLEVKLAKLLKVVPQDFFDLLSLVCDAL